MLHGGAPLTRTAAAAAVVPLLLLSLVLVNAQAVTSLTSERDVRAFDLLLVTDLTPKEIVFGKLGGVFYNTKEMVLLPLALCGYLWWAGPWAWKTCSTCWAAWPCSTCFVAVLGLHAGMTYANSRSAIATSLGTVFFLFLGVATCMRIMVAFSGLVPGPVAAVSGLHDRRRRGALRGPGRPQSLDGHRRGLVRVPVRHLLRHRPASAGLHAGRVPGDRGRLRLHHGGHARAGDLRVRRGHGKDDERMRDEG